jgi:hypothetical protein
LCTPISKIDSLVRNTVFRFGRFSPILRARNCAMANRLKSLAPLGIDPSTSLGTSSLARRGRITSESKLAVYYAALLPRLGPSVVFFAPAALCVAHPLFSSCPSCSSWPICCFLRALRALRGPSVVFFVSFVSFVFFVAHLLFSSCPSWLICRLLRGFRGHHFGSAGSGGAGTGSGIGGGAAGGFTTGTGTISRLLI